MATYSEHEQRMLDQQSGAEMDRRAENTKKGAVGKFECHLVGKMQWEVRLAGAVVATATAMNEAFNKATRLNAASKPAPVDPKWDPIANEPDNGDRFW